MLFERGNIGFFIAFVIIGGILGSAIGSLIVKSFPVMEIIKKNLTEPISVSLEIISLNIRLNLAAIVGIIAGIFIFRKV